MGVDGTKQAPIEAHCIDSAASGHPRHCFVRALYASWFVTIAFMVGVVILWALPVGMAAPNPDGTKWLGIILVVPFYVAVLLFQVVCSIVMTAASINAVHRRLIGLGCLLFYAPIALVAPMIAVSEFAGAAGIQTVRNATPASETALGVAFVIVSVVAFEAAAQAWWQVTVGREAFFSVRGWRPPPFFVLSTFFRQLGLPAFLSFTRGDVLLPVLYFGVAVLNAWIVAALLLVGFVGTAGRDSAGMAFAVVMATVVLLQAAGVGRKLQAIADRHESRRYQWVRQWDARPPIVFLRSFFQDDARVAPQTNDPFLRMISGVTRARTLDELILEHASPYGPVIAIGDPRDPTPPLGAARIFVSDADGGWQEVVGSLVNAACAVVMCPTTTDGVSWELDFLAQTNAGARTIFLASPVLSDAQTKSVFETLVLKRDIVLPPRQTPIAAFCDPARGWRVLSARKRSVSSYTAAFNMAIQAMFGLSPRRPVRPPSAAVGPRAPAVAAGPQTRPAI
jgi:hypothetical protein